MIKLENELGWKIKEIDIFRIKTSRWIHRITYHSIWISMRWEIKQQNNKKKVILKIKKTMKFCNINLIYWSNLKSNAIRQKIKKKTYNLTQNRTQNDPINQ